MALEKIEDKDALLFKATVLVMPAKSTYAFQGEEKISLSFYVVVTKLLR